MGIRIQHLTSIFLILFLLLTFGMVYWQVIDGPALAANPHNGRQCLPGNQPLRGTIYDRNGVKLAWSEADPNAPCGYDRKYSDPTLAPLIGYFSTRYGESGIEKQFNAELSGQADSSSLGNAWNQLLHLQTTGENIYLTIDEKIQQVANQSFDQTKGTQKGSVIVEDPRNGEILAMVSRPFFDPNRISANDDAYWNQLQQDPNSPLVNRPTQGLYPPGSTFKTVTLAAALDSGQFQLNTPFDQKAATSTVIDGFKIDANNLPANVPFPVTLEQGYAYSDNVIYAEVGKQLGQSTWTQYVKNFGLDQPLDTDFPANTSTINAQSANFDDVLLATSAFGQGNLQVTPLQMAMITSTIADNGQLLKPYVILKVVPNGVDPNSVSATTPTPLGNPITPATANQVEEAMRSVVTLDLGRLPIARDANQIGGKTGTAQVGGNANPHAWFLSIAPFNSPRLAVVAMKENSGEGFQFAMPVAQYAIDHTMPLLTNGN